MFSKRWPRITATLPLGLGGKTVPPEEFDVLPDRDTGYAQLLAYPTLAGTGGVQGVQFVNQFCFSHVYLLVRHGAF